LKKYLLDTNICIFFLKGKNNIISKIEDVGEQNCFISEMTVAELKFGAENSKIKEEMKKIVAPFIKKFTIIPIFDSLDIYAAEKARLRKIGMIIDDFDLLIGATAIYHNMVLATNNVSHLNRLNNIMIEDWLN